MKASQMRRMRCWLQVKNRARLPFAGFLFVLLTVSVVNEYEIFRFSPLQDPGVWSQIYRQVSLPFARLSRIFLIDTRWRMYSPSWKRNIWIEWVAVTSTGEQAPWPTPHFGRGYRDQTSALWRELFELKEPKIQSELAHTDFARRSFGLFLCHQYEVAKKAKAKAMKPIWREFKIPPPSEKWSLQDIEVSRYADFKEIPCL